MALSMRPPHHQMARRLDLQASELQGCKGLRVQGLRLAVQGAGTMDSALGLSVGSMSQVEAGVMTFLISQSCEDSAQAVLLGSVTFKPQESPSHRHKASGISASIPGGIFIMCPVTTSGRTCRGGEGRESQEQRYPAKVVGPVQPGVKIGEF